VLSLLVMGDHVNVRVDDAARRAPELQTLLSARNVSAGDIARVEPGIEDVFVALVGSEGAP